MLTDTGTYVYCVVAATRLPRMARTAKGLPGAERMRLLDAGDGLFIVVAHVPLKRYGEEALRQGLADLDWVSRAAVAHEQVVESFVAERAVLPMKLFTIFTSDARAVEHVRAERARIAAFVKRVANQQEWGVRVILDKTLAASAAARQKPTRGRSTAAAEASGAAYLTRKKAQRDAATELAEHARETVAGLYDRLAARARLAKRRPASEMPVSDGPLLLDAAFLVPRARTASFRAMAVREAKTLSRSGYGLTLSGPWPPYTFVQD
jgi:hypothetical protein